VLMRQVLQNLIDNAIKYSSRQSQALIAIHDCTAGRNADETVIEVRDNGVGFDAHYADKLFQLFHRLHGNGEFPGTGVGLALAAKIMALHGGRIWAQSRVEHGASFFIAFPRQSGTDAEPGR
jgi:two-component system, chemotaxis family, sensor kinase Cph1